MGTPKDLTEMVFGRLTAKEIVRVEPKLGAVWRCECSCGGEKEVPAVRLTGKKTKSCGCLNREIKERSNITGQRFGLLEAICFDHADEKNRSHWLFKCDCGNQKILPINSVKWSGVRSCGCLAEKHIKELNRQNITGERFDRLTAIRPTDERDNSGSILWEFGCDCGNTIKLSVNTFRKGKVHSCGCLYNETRQDCVKSRKDIADHTSISSLVAAKKTMKTNTSGYTGVYFDKRSERWNAYINFKKKRYYLGSYRDIEDAVRARKDAEERIHDPAILERMNDLTAERKAEFLAYLSGTGESANRAQREVMQLE